PAMVQATSTRAKRQSSIGGEAVEQSVSARAYQSGHTAASARVRGIPRRWRNALGLQVGMPDPRTALAAAGPIGAGAILAAGGKRRSVELRAGQCVVPRRPPACLGHDVLLGDALRLLAMKFRNVLGDHRALGV